jgi:Leucine-rich repeat (LRR) protein
MAPKLAVPQRSASKPAVAAGSVDAQSTADGGKKLPFTMVRLNNNAIESLLPLYRVLDSLLLDASNLTWIDLSFNAITAIGAAFKRLPHLKRLYLHSNCISLLSEAENLQDNRELTVLTLHANPVQEKENYRIFRP